MGRQSGWRHKPGIYKACPNEAVTSFLCLYKRSVWNCLSYLVLSVLTLNTKKTDMANKQQQTFRMCVCLCPRYLMGGDTHILCVACLGEKHAQSRALTVSPARCFPCGHSDPAWRSFTVLGFEGADCEYCKVLPLWTLRSRLVFCTVLGFANGSISGARDTALSLPSLDRSSASYQGWEARIAVSSAPIEAQTLQLILTSDSEDLDVVSAYTRETEDSPL